MNTKVAVLAFLATVLAFTGQGCVTSAPSPHHGSIVSYVGGVQNSGLIAEVDGGYIVPQAFVDEYNRRITLNPTYAKLRGLTANAGVVARKDALYEGDYFIDKEHWVYYGVMGDLLGGAVTPPLPK